MWGDFRLSTISVTDAAGVRGADFLYVSHEISPGKYALNGLPAAHDEDNEAETLTVRLQDPVTGLGLELLYGVFERQDVITRAVRLANHGNGALQLHKVASACLDLPFGQWDLIHFHGRHAMERQVQRVAPGGCHPDGFLHPGCVQPSPQSFVILCDRQATEEAGACCGVMPVLFRQFPHRCGTDPERPGPPGHRHP